MSNKVVHFEFKHISGFINKESYLEIRSYCPKCGHKSVWVNCDDGDYYVGSDYICHECGIVFTMQADLDFKPTDRIKQMIIKLKQSKESE